MEGFRLLSFTAQQKDSLWSERKSFQFSDGEQSDEGFPYTSLVIGPNGTGKSRLLRALVDSLNAFYLVQESKRAKLFLKFTNYFELVYSLHGKVFRITGENGTIPICFRNKSKTPIPINKVQLPSKLIALSFSVHDKMPQKYLNVFGSNDKRLENDFYEYLGGKTATNSISSIGQIYKMLDLITENIGNIIESKNIPFIFDYLGFTPKIEIVFGFGYHYHELLSGKLTLGFLKNVINKSKRENERNKLGLYSRNYVKLEKLSEVELEKIVIQINDIAKIRRLKKSLILDFNNSSEIKERSMEYRTMSLLRRLGVIGYRRVYVFKSNHPPFDIKESSSGEIQILTSMLSLASVIKSNSIILIDEPEVSLHPNWQMQYIELLNNLFKNTGGCHFIISTHSHFLASDLKPNNSAILSITPKQESSDINVEYISDPTFGWSAENILYNIFNVLSSRNKYVGIEVGKLLEEISKFKSEPELIKEQLLKLNELKISLKKYDPLKMLITNVEKEFKAK